MLNDFRDFFQAFILPQFEGLKGDIRALDSKIDSLDAKFEVKFELLDAKIGAHDTKIGALDSKLESFRRELVAEIHRVEHVLSTDFVRLEQKIDLRLASMDK